MGTKKSPAVTGPKYTENQRPNYTTSDVVNQFRTQMDLAGIILPEHFPTGEIFRCDVKGKKPGNKAASVCLHLDGWPAGWFENFTDGMGVRKWRYCSENSSPPPIDFDHKAHEAKLKAQRERMESNRQEKRDQAACRAKHLYATAKPASPSHEYLVQKRIKPYHTRQTGNVLLVPLLNGEFELVNIQRIYPDGSKRFLPGGQIKGCFCLLGRINPGNIIYICEGFSTGATIREMTHEPVVCAMNAGNLLPVALAIRKACPRSRILVAGDDDRQTEGNPGRTKAHEAAFTAKGMVTFPNFCSPQCSCTDFNDVACCYARRKEGTV